MEYKKFHILDFTIEDKTQRNGRDVSISVDTNEMITIELGNTITLKTDEDGVHDLHDALENVLDRLDEIHNDNRKESIDTKRHTIVSVTSSKDQGNVCQSEQQSVDVWNSNDPINW